MEGLNCTRKCSEGSEFVDLGSVPNEVTGTSASEGQVTICGGRTEWHVVVTRNVLVKDGRSAIKSRQIGLNVKTCERQKQLGRTIFFNQFYLMKLVNSYY